MIEKRYIFHDLQTGGRSAHDTLDGLCDMLLDDLRKLEGTGAEDLGDTALIYSFERGEWTEQKKIDFIRNHEYVAEEIKQ